MRCREDKMRRANLTVLAIVVVLVGPRLMAQTPNAFTAEDILKVATASILDLTEDGSRVAVAIRKLEDNATTDHRRFGDPTYVAPSMVDLVVYDTRTGT